MKNLFLIFIVASLSLISEEVDLKINYHIDGKTLKYGEVYTNKNNINFKVARFQYYICGVELNDKKIDGLYILANGFRPSYSLGEFENEVITKIKFDLGVDSSNNVGVDPNSFPIFHALAPKNPSMHWGWSAGYRFWAIEGVSDPDGDGTFDKSFQYHVIGDDALKSVSLNVDTKKIDDKININIDFDVQKLLSVVDMSTFSVYHGFSQQYPEIKEFVTNISSSNAITIPSINSIENQELTQAKLYPNPSSSVINLNGDLLNTSYEILDINGNILKSGEVSTNSISIGDIDQGIYFVIFKRDGYSIENIKFIKE